jgi:hypothetical protein
MNIELRRLHGARFQRSSDVRGRPLQRDGHSGNLRRAVVVASAAPFDPSALMLNWYVWTWPGGGDGPVKPEATAPHGTAGCPR